MKKTVLNTALIVTLGFAVSACSSDKEGESHEVLAKDRVDAAAELARAKAPAAEDMAFSETATMPAAEVDGTEADVPATEADMAAVTATDSVETNSPEIDSADVAVATETDMPAADATTDAEPATN